MYLKDFFREIELLLENQIIFEHSVRLCFVKSWESVFIKIKSPQRLISS